MYIVDSFMWFLLQTLLYGERYPCEVGKLPENITKNRFKTTFPCGYQQEEAMWTVVSSIFFEYQLI